MQPATRFSPTVGPHAMRKAAVASLVLHLLALATLVALPGSLPQPPEPSPAIEMSFVAPPATPPPAALPPAALPAPVAPSPPKASVPAAAAPPEVAPDIAEPPLPTALPAPPSPDAPSVPASVEAPKPPPRMRAAAPVRPAAEARPHAAPNAAPVATETVTRAAPAPAAAPSAPVKSADPPGLAPGLVRAIGTPPYPPAALRRREQGSVTLSIEVDAEGHAVSVSVVRSSGSAILDNAAVALLRGQAYRRVAGHLEDTVNYVIGDDAG